MVNPPVWSGGGRRERTCGILPISLKGISNMFPFPFLITQQLILNWTPGVMTAQMRNTESLDWTFLWHETHFWDSLWSSLCCGISLWRGPPSTGTPGPMDSDCLHSHICLKCMWQPMIQPYSRWHLPHLSLFTFKLLLMLTQVFLGFKCWKTGSLGMGTNTEHED